MFEINEKVIVLYSAGDWWKSEATIINIDGEFFEVERTDGQTIIIHKVYLNKG